MCIFNQSSVLKRIRKNVADQNKKLQLCTVKLNDLTKTNACILQNLKRYCEKYNLDIFTVVLLVRVTPQKYY